jgi:hypothetical protein
MVALLGGCLTGRTKVGSQNPHGIISVHRYVITGHGSHSDQESHFVPVAYSTGAQEQELGPSCFNSDGGRWSIKGLAEAEVFPIVRYGRLDQPRPEHVPSLQTASHGLSCSAKRVFSKMLLDALSALKSYNW